jgi:hypothetical protein
VLPSRLVASFREAPDQFLEDVAHSNVGHCSRGDIQVCELGRDRVEKAGLVKALDLLLEAVLHKHVRSARREASDVRAEVRCNVFRVVEQPPEVQRRGVVERHSSDTLQDLGPVVQPLALKNSVLRQDCSLRRCQGGVQPA